VPGQQCPCAILHASALCPPDCYALPSVAMIGSGAGFQGRVRHLTHVRALAAPSARAAVPAAMVQQVANPTHCGVRGCMMLRTTKRGLL